MNIINCIQNLLNFKHTKPAINHPDSFTSQSVTCVCCEQSFKTFMPFGVIKRPNALCPGCGSLERHRLHWHYLSNKTNLLKVGAKIRLLHVAPEIIFFNKFINNPLIDYVPCARMGDGYEDVYPPNTINADITQLDFNDNSFDVIYCSHVLEHIPDDQLAMREMWRVLKPGGWAVLQVPLDTDRDITYEDFAVTDPLDREKRFGQKDHVRIYGNDYKERLSKAGFLVKVDRYLQEFSDKEISRYGFMKREDIYFCTKL